MNENIEHEIVKLHIRIGQNVKQKRENKGFSQLKLSHDIGQKSTTIISQGELAKNKHFNIEQLYKISQALDCDICEFFN